MNKEKIELYAHVGIIAVAACIIFIIFARYAFMMILPFLIGWAVAFCVRPLAAWLNRKIHLPTKLGSLLLALFLVLIVFGLVSVAVWRISVELWELISGIRGEDVYGVLSKIINPFKGLFGSDSGAEELELRLGAAIEKMLSSGLASVGGVITSFVSSLPGAFIFLLVTVISALYFSLDLAMINAWVRSVLPGGALKWLLRLKRGMFTTGIGYLRSYLVLMAVTFVIMLVGLMIMRVEYALLAALVIAFLDMLPIIGVGAILVPWSIIQLVLGNYSFGIGLLVLFLVHEFIRQIIEPKIVGKHLGIHPIVTLVLIYVGYSLFGVFGLLLLPVFTVIIDVLSNKDNSSEVKED